MLTSWDDNVCRAPDFHHSTSCRRRNLRHGIITVLLGVLVLLLVPRASAQSRDDFSYWDANGNGDLTCTEAQGRDEGLRLPAYQDDRDGTGIIYEWLERTRSSDTDNDGIGCDSASNPNGYIPNVQPQPPVDPQGCPADTVTWRGLKVCDERPRDGYDRDAFGTGYSSLEDDIIAALPPTMKANGKVYTPYSCIAFDITTSGTAATDIEHMVALAEAHDSGIDDDRRRDIASDLDNLTIADPTVNRSQKGDRDAAEWMPARHGAWFAERVIQVKLEYGLSVDPAERDALEALFAGGGTQLNCVAADEPTPTTLTLAAVPVPAEGGEPVTVTAMLDNPAPAEGTTVTLTASGTATSADYALSSTTITIAEGETTGTATITITEDAEDDDGETIVLDAESTNPALTAPPLTLTIEDNNAVPMPAGGPTYYFPHLAVGASWQTTITYINYSPQQVSCQTDFLSDHGSPLMVSFADKGTVVSRTDVLDPGGSVHQETNVGLSAPLAPGWARATCSGPVKASLLFRQHNSAGVPVAEAGVNAATVPATRFVTFAEQGEGKSGTGVAYANPSVTAALVTFTAMDADGEMLASVVRTLLPGGHGAQNMEGLFDLSSFTGSLEITSTEPIVTLSLNFEAAPVFSSLPSGELDAAAQGSTTHYFPHLAVGASWQTTITYINYSSQQVSCTTDFLSDHGSPLMVSFADKGTVVSRTDVLDPGGSVHQETNVGLSAPLAPGWARATCSGLVKASLLFRQHNSAGVPVAEAGVNAATVPATRFVTFAEQGEGKSGTGVAYANPSDTTTAFVTFAVRDAAGNELARTAPQTLLPRGHGAQNMEGLFDLTSFTGSLEITSTEPIVTLSLNFEAAPVFSSLPSGELDAAPDVPGDAITGTITVVSLEISGMAALTSIGETIQLSVTANMSDGSRQAVGNALLQWQSSDLAVVTVLEGTVTAVGGGNATITAIYDEERTVDTPISVHISVHETGTVRVLYAVPKDRVFRSDYRQAIQHAIVDIQSWYRQKLEGLTFSLYDATPEQCQLSAAADFYGRYSWQKVVDGVQHCAPVEGKTSAFTWVVYVDVELECAPDGSAGDWEQGYDQLGRGGPGLVILPRDDLDGLIGEKIVYYGKCGGGPWDGPVRRWIGGLGHEIGHTFGLPHPPGCDEGLPTCDFEALMHNGYQAYPDTYLRPDEKAILRSSPFIGRN